MYRVKKWMQTKTREREGRRSFIVFFPLALDQVEKS